MLFWAGLRGAVGVALAAGFTGPNKDALWTTVLTVVMLKVIRLGGTTSRMLEVMSIRMGIDDGGGDSSTDEYERAWLRSGWLGHAGARWDEWAKHAAMAEASAGRSTKNLSSPTRVRSAADHDSDGGDVPVPVMGRIY